MRPLEMLLRVEPLNRSQKEALVGFIVIQRLRNPIFISSLRQKMVPVVKQEVGEAQADDLAYMRSVYETLYENNQFYDVVARPVFENKWVVVKSDTPSFVLPDRCNLFGRYNGLQYVIMPITPKACLIITPYKDVEKRIVPYYLKGEDLSKNILKVLVLCAHKEFISQEPIQIEDSHQNELNELIQRIFQHIEKEIFER